MRLLVADTETASLKGGVCDIAIVQINADFEVLWQAESLIDPECEISPQASGIHHLTNDMVADAPTLSEFMQMHNYPLDCDDLVIAGHNISFDCRMLASELPQSYTKLCTLRLAREIWPDAEDHKLQTLRYKFGLDAGSAHRAMGDVKTCLSLLKFMAQEVKTNFHGLIALAKKPISLKTKIAFGKHKGTPLCDLSDSYVSWLLNSTDNLDPDLREALLTR